MIEFKIIIKTLGDNNKNDNKRDNDTSCIWWA